MGDWGKRIGVAGAAFVALQLWEAVRARRSAEKFAQERANPNEGVVSFSDVGGAARRAAESRGAESCGAARDRAARRGAALRSFARLHATRLPVSASRFSRSPPPLAPPSLSRAPVPAHALPAQYLAARRAAVQAQPKLLDVRNFSLENLEGVKAPANSVMR